MPNYFTSPTFWFLFFSSLAATCLLTPAVMVLARRIGAVDRGGYRKIYNGAMPLLGGLAVAGPFAGVCVAGLIGPTHMLEALHGRMYDLLVLATGCAAIVAVGIVDDTRGMRARTKLFFQTLIALFVALSGNAVTTVGLPVVGTVHLGPVLGTFVAMLWIVGLVNAFNLVDGMDGLASGLALIASVALGILAALNGSTFVVLLCVALAGSLLGFLMYNFHPAKIFLGDTGSMFLGFALASITLMDNYKTHATVIFLPAVLALGLPIFETMLSIVRRYVRGKPLFSGDQEHTHHRLLKKGFTQRQVALILYSAAVLCLVAAVLFQLSTVRAHVSWMPLGLYVSTVLGVAWMAGYLRLPEVRRQSRRRPHNQLLSAFSRYASMSLSSDSPFVTSTELMRIARRELGLRYLEAWFEEGPTQIVSSGRLRLSARAGAPAFVAAPDGFVTDEELRALRVDTLKTLRVRSAGGYEIIIRYQFYSEPDELVAQDIGAALANLFEQTRLTPPALSAAERGRPRYLEVFGQ